PPMRKRGWDFWRVSEIWCGPCSRVASGCGETRNGCWRSGVAFLHDATQRNMPTYTALLRGINVSGHKVIKMEALRASFGALRLSNIQTYVQSGNVVFGAGN